MEPEKAVEEEGRETGDLVEAGVPPESWFVWLGRAVVLPHIVLPRLVTVLWWPSQEDMGSVCESFQTNFLADSRGLPRRSPCVLASPHLRWVCKLTSDQTRVRITRQLAARSTEYFGPYAK
jgi:hypothetical protein